jgi:hypothetical protein
VISARETAGRDLRTKQRTGQCITYTLVIIYKVWRCYRQTSYEAVSFPSLPPLAHILQIIAGHSVTLAWQEAMETNTPPA